MQIEHDAVGFASLQGLEELGPGRKHLHAHARGAEQPLEGPPYVFLVVDNRDQEFFRGHCRDGSNRRQA